MVIIYQGIYYKLINVGDRFVLLFLRSKGFTMIQYILVLKLVQVC